MSFPVFPLSGGTPRFGVSLPRPDLGGMAHRIKKAIQRDATPRGFTRVEIHGAASLKTVEDRILKAFDQFELVAPRTEDQIVKNINDTFLHDVGNIGRGPYKAASYDIYYQNYEGFVTGKVTYGLKPKAGATSNITSVRYTVEARGKSGTKSNAVDPYLERFREELVVETQDKHRLYYQRDQKDLIADKQLALSALNKRLNDKIRSLQEQGRLYLQNKDQIAQDESAYQVDRLLQV